MIIPDLEEDGGDADGRVAQAPRNVHRKIPTLNDLEDEVKAAIPSIEGGFDLKVLLSTLVPPGQVQEQDVTWYLSTHSPTHLLIYSLTHSLKVIRFITARRN